jgi:formylglycine-generating enzyme required for sulfatase activity/GTPase SAR1 family protein
MQEFLEYLKHHPSVTKYGYLVAIVSSGLIGVYKILPTKFKEELQSKSYGLFFKWIGDSWNNRETTANLKKHYRSIIEQLETPSDGEYVPEFISLTLIRRRNDDSPDLKKTPEEPVTIEQLLDREFSSLLIIGPPGSGKTTLLKRFMYEYAKRYLKKSNQPIPVFLELKYYEKEKSPEDWVLQKLKNTLNVSLSLTGKTKERLVLLLDGFNEIRGGADGETIYKWKEFLNNLEQSGKHRALITWRDREYDSELGAKDLIGIQDLSLKQIEEFVSKNIPQHKERLIHDLRVRDSNKSTSFSSIFSTPYFLMMLRTICSTEEYPEYLITANTAQLFSLFFRKILVDEYQGSKARDIFDPKEGLFNEDELAQIRQNNLPRNKIYYLPEKGKLFSVLGELALEMQEKSKIGIDRDQLPEIVRPEIIRNAGYVCRILRDDRGEDSLSFYHQLIQEYFAARRFKNSSLPEKAAISRTEPFNARWEEVTLMALTMMNSDEQEVFLSGLVKYNPILAARALETIFELDEIKTAASVRNEIRTELLEWIKAPSEFMVRVRAGEALGNIGDPRFETRRRQSRHGSYTVIEPPVVKVESGVYPAGQENQRVSVDEFHIGQYHITNAEYRCFIKAGGYENEKWWDTADSLRWIRGEARELLKGSFWEVFASHLYPSDTNYRRPHLIHHRDYNNSSQPVVGVSWFEARAFCNWLSFETGEAYRLPTELEYEVATRGKGGRQYSAPNGFDPTRYNTKESGVGRPTVVGVLDNQTPEGAFDLTGNVWSWTSTIYDTLKYPFPPSADDDRENPDATGVNRLVRGGSWDGSQDIARAAFRGNRNPALRNYFYGFRVVGGLRPPSQNH